VSFIKLKIHPEHPKVLWLAAKTGADAEHVFSAAVRWFMWVDQHCLDETTGLPPAGVDAICKLRARRGTPPLSALFQERDVRWIEVGGDGYVRVVDFRENFENTSKMRLEAAEARRQADLERKRQARGVGESAESPQPVRGKSADVPRPRRQSGAPDEMRSKPVQSYDPRDISPSGLPAPAADEKRESGAGVDGTGLALIGESPCAGLAVAWAGGAPVESGENAAAVLTALRRLRVGSPVCERLVLARALTVPQIETERSALLEDIARGRPGTVKDPHKVLVSRLMRAAGVPKTAQRFAALRPEEQRLVAEVEAIRRRMGVAA
jgi:hypothetical protein